MSSKFVLDGATGIWDAAEGRRRGMYILDNILMDKKMITSF